MNTVCSSGVVPACGLVLWLPVPRRAPYGIWHLHGPAWEYRQAEGARNKEESGIGTREAVEEGWRPRTPALVGSVAPQNTESDQPRQWTGNFSWGRKSVSRGDQKHLSRGQGTACGLDANRIGSFPLHPGATLRRKWVCSQSSFGKGKRADREFELGK